MLRGCEIFQFTVIESYRDGGKVKHRTLAYLSSLPSECFGYWRRDTVRVLEFWDICDEKLKRFPESERLRLAARIETVVPRLSEEDEQGARKLALLASEIRSLLQSAKLAMAAIR